MKNTGLLLVMFTFFAVSFIQADEGFCTKCNIMRDYHKKNPSKYKYYDDYLKDVEENGEDAANPSKDDMPPEVRYIMDAEHNTFDTED